MRWTRSQYDAYITQFSTSSKLSTPCGDGELFEPDPGPESSLQRKIEAWCREWGRPYLSFHQSPKAKHLLPPGWPDMEIIMPEGQTLRLELKSSTGRLSPEQKQLKLQFMTLGHKVHLVKSFRAFLELVGNPKLGPKSSPQSTIKIKAAPRLNKKGKTLLEVFSELDNE